MQKKKKKNTVPINHTSRTMSDPVTISGFLRSAHRYPREKRKQKADDKHHRLCRLFSKFHNKKPLRITEIVRVSEKFNCQGALLCG